jgi:MFS family permease
VGVAARTPHSRTPGWIQNILAVPAFRYRDFRYLWFAVFFNSISRLGELVALSWLVLERTDSPFMVGVALGIRMVPHFFVGLLGGALVDRFDRRHLMRLLNLGMAAMAALIGVLIMFDVVGLWQILALTLVSGVFRSLFQISRSSFSFDIVGPRNVISGQALSALAMRFGGIVGSVSMGFIVKAYGVDAAYIVLAFGYLAATLLLLPIRSAGQSAPVNRQPVWQNLKEYFSELRSNRTLTAILLLTVGTETLGFSHQAVLPSLVRDVLHVGPEWLGIMTAFRSAGGVVGVVILTAMGEVRRKGLVMLLSILVFGISVIVLGYASTLSTAIIVVTVVNMAGFLSDILGGSIMQLVVPNEQRGRAAGSWVLAIGTSPIGQLQMGGLASAISVSLALTLNGVGLVILAVACLLFVPRLRKL